MTTNEPLTIGGIFDRAVTIVVPRWTLLLPWAVALGVVNVVSELINAVGANVWAFGVAEPIALAGSVVVFNAMVAIVADFGGAYGLGSLLRLSLRRFWSALGLTLIYYLAVIAAVFVSFIPSSILRYHEAGLAIAAFILGIGLAIAAVSFLTGYACIGYANVVLESLTPLAAIRAVKQRSTTTGSWRLLILGAALCALTLLPTFGVGAIPHQPPFLLLCKLALMFALLTPVYMYATAVETVAAIDYRNRSTGADLAHALNGRAPK